MAKLHRPYIPFEVRCRVALAQHRKKPPNDPGIERSLLLEHPQAGGLGYVKYLALILHEMFGDDADKAHLDHDPALCNRRKRLKTIKHNIFGPKRITVYSPDANDPKHLIYRIGGKVGDGSPHDIKTRVRGEHGQLSDLAIARKEKRRAKKATRNRKGGFPIGSASGFRKGASQVKRTAPKIQSRGFPPKGSRKFRSAAR